MLRHQSWLAIMVHILNNFLYPKPLLQDKSCLGPFNMLKLIEHTARAFFVFFFFKEGYLWPIYSFSGDVQKTWTLINKKLKWMKKRNRWAVSVTISHVWTILITTQICRRCNVESCMTSIGVFFFVNYENIQREIKSTSFSSVTKKCFSI